MKRLIILTGILLFSFSSCQDYLDEENPGNIVASEFYSTASGYESLVNSVYGSLRTVYTGDGDRAYMFCAGTDMYVEGRNDQPEGLSEYRNLIPSDGIVQDFYSDLYSAIQSCNTAIYYNDKTEDATTLEARLGEVKFLRGFYYFLMVQTYGGVSIVDEFIEEAVTEFNRNTAAEVYDFILEDMNAALSLVPETATEYGRVDKRVIRHFLSKVYLTRGYETFGESSDFTNAASFAEAAIAGQGLNLSFDELFWPGNEENEEILFSIQFDKASIQDATDDGNTQNYYFGPYLGGEGALYGYPYRSYTLCPTMYLFDAFTENDSRFEGTFMVEYYERYYDYFDKNDELAELNVQYYYAPEWALSDTTAWRAANPATRTDAVIVPYSIEWQASNQTTFDGGTPIVKKFDDPTASFSGSGSSNRDFFLARLGETYLIAAEAYLQLGQTDKAAEMINVVRTRAAVDGQEAAMQISGADVDIDFILDERARELVGEYHRWFDLKRTGQLVERTKSFNRDVQVYFNQGVNPFQGTDGELKTLRPIPQSALDLNEADFAQNPGY
ncbi:MAG: RagB/SusD family nutrient uptake outer membrane protein [Thalassobius sp.]|nr:RagB/SusD family nutrient uptake outer membrane protein [Thalassovita sp.]